MRISPPIVIVWLALAAPAAAQDQPRPPVIVAPPPPPPIRIGAPPAPPPPRGATAAAPIPTTNPGTWVTPDDYPEWAVRYDVIGMVRFALDVDRNGRVTGCTIRQSSGVADLDRVACEKVTERGRFLPARDAAGNAVAGTWVSAVRWEIPEDEPEPAPQPGRVVFSFIIEPDGSVSECRIDEIKGRLEPPDDPPCAGDAGFLPVRGADGKPERRRVRVTMQIDHESLP